MLNKGALVLEGVTLAGVVQLVVEVLVDLSGSTVLHEKTAENTHAAHPEDLGGHTGVGSSLTLTVSGVTSSTLGVLESAGAAAGVHGLGLLDDETVGNQLADGLTCVELVASRRRSRKGGRTGVGVGDLGHLVGVQPDLSLSAVHDGRSETLLSAKVDPESEDMLVNCPLS